MLALLIYCYATGRFGFPDDRGGELQRRGGALPLRQPPPRSRLDLHVSDRQQAGVRAAFVSVLQLAQHLRLSKVARSASMAPSQRQQACRGKLRAGSEMIAQFGARSAGVDRPSATSRESGNQRSPRHSGRADATRGSQSGVAAGAQVIEARAKEMAAAQQADYQAKQAKRQAQRDAGKKPRGPEPTASERDARPEGTIQLH